MFWNFFGDTGFPDDEIYPLPQFLLLFLTLAFQVLLFVQRFLVLEIPVTILFSVLVSEIAVKDDPGPGLRSLFRVDTNSSSVRKN